MPFNYKWRLADGYPSQGIKSNGLKVFSTFACGGGSSMGYKLAGFDVIGANDIDPKMSKVYQQNHKPKLFFECPINELLTKELPQELYELDILDGSPPCSTFSLSGLREKVWKKNKKFKEGQAEQILSDLFFDWIALVGKLKPKVAIAENVAGMLVGNAKAYTAKIIEELNKIGYEVQVFLLDASTMGVPQRRRRVFFICRRADLKLPQIKMEFNEQPVYFGEYREEQGVTKGLSPRIKELMAHKIHSDKCLSDINERLYNKVSGFNAMLLKDNEVCPTITASSHNFRFCDGLVTTTQDLALTGSFPTDYDYGTIIPKYLIGMSVPPVMMAQVANQVAIQIFKV